MIAFLLTLFSVGMALNQYMEGATEIQHYAKEKWTSEEYHGIRVAERLGLFMSIYTMVFVGMFTSIDWQTIIGLLIIVTGNGLSGLSWYELGKTRNDGGEIWRVTSTWTTNFPWKIVVKRDRTWRYYTAQLVLGYSICGIGLLLMR